MLVCGKVAQDNFVELTAASLFRLPIYNSKNYLNVLEIDAENGYNHFQYNLSTAIL